MSSNKMKQPRKFTQNETVSPRPWKLEKSQGVISDAGTGDLLLEVYNYGQKTCHNAVEHAVLCVNEHPELVRIAKALVGLLYVGDDENHANEWRQLYKDATEALRRVEEGT